MHPSSGNKLYYSLLILAVLFLFFVGLSIGPVRLALSDVFNLLLGKTSENIDRAVFWQFRFSRAITAVFVGFALAISGLMMQTFFRNPLAGPYVLGISSGAGLGVALLVMGFPLIAPHSGSLPSNLNILLAASGGAAFSMLLVFLVSLKVRDTLTLLILGILFGGALSAIISILQYFSTENALRIYVIWTLGSLGGVTLSQLQVFLPAVLVGILIALYLAKSLNAFLLGVEDAKGLGVNILVTRILVFASTSILAGSVTAFCGPVGFVGVAVPHMARFLFNTSDHRVLMPGSLLMGALIMQLSDLLTFIPPDNVILPVNAITALLGIPVIIWIVLSNKS